MRNGGRYPLYGEPHAEHEVDCHGQKQRRVADEDALHPRFYAGPGPQLDVTLSIRQFVLAGGVEEEQNRREFQDAGNRQRETPLPQVSGGEPMQDEAGGPQAPAGDG